MPFGGLLTAGLIAAGSAIGGAASSRTETKTPIYTTDQNAVQGDTASAIEQRLTDPSSILDPLQSQAAGQINQNYQGLDNTMSQQLASRGFGQSGKVGTNLTQNELSRQSDLGSLASRFAGYNIDLQNQAIQEGTQFGFAGAGTKDVNPGNAAASGIGGFVGSGGVGDLMSILGGG